MSNEVNVSRAAADDPRATLKANVEAKFAEAFEKAKLELTQTGIGNPANLWEVYAWGPWQDPGQAPGRIIMVGEKAYIAVAVWMNTAMCADVVGFDTKFELNFYTSNTQTMEPVPALNYSCCIFPKPGTCYYVTVWEFSPSEEACLLETNICARLCTCGNKLVPQYAGFVRHVYDFDPDNLFPPYPFPPGWQFDRPIRYMVADPKRPCGCDPNNPCP